LGSATVAQTPPVGALRLVAMAELRATYAGFTIISPEEDRQFLRKPKWPRGLR